MKHILILLIATALIGITVREAAAHSSYTGRTLKSGTQAGCSCHASQSTAVVVAISGPDTLKVGAEGTYTVKISGGNGSTVCVNIATSAGALKTADATTKLSGGELITNGVKKYSGGSYTYTFKLTAPATAQALTLYATGMSTMSTFNHAPNKTVTVIPAVTEVEASASPAPVSALLGNYPDPFRSSTTINFSLADRGRVRLAVYDLAGQQIDALSNRMEEAGTHAVPFDGSRLPTGLYFVRLTGTLANGDAVNLTRRMVLAR
jgi:hypothetical protein